MKLRTQLLLGYVTVFLLMILMAAVSFRSSRSLQETQDLVEHSSEVMVTGRMVQTALADMQSAKRGYLIVGQEEYLQPYEDGKRAYDEDMARLEELVAGDRSRIENLREIDALVDRWLTTVVQPDIEQRRSIVDNASALATIAQNIQEEEKGSPIFTDIRDKMNAFIAVERDLLGQQRDAEAAAVRRDTLAVLGFAGLAVLIGLTSGLYVTRSVLLRVGGEPSEIAGVTEQIARGNLDVEIRGGTGIRASVAKMLEALRENRIQTRRRDWLKSGIARLNQATSGDPDLKDLSSKAIAEISTYLNASIGALYVADEESDPKLTLAGGYAYEKRAGRPGVFRPGEGLVGQAALQKRQIVISNVPADYVKVTSGLGERVPLHLCLTPFLHEGRLKGVVEIGMWNEIGDEQQEYLKQAMPVLAVAVEAAQSRTRLGEALEESQRLTEELQVQQEELRVTNEELEQQTQRLKASEEKLRMQHEELEATNEELEEKNELLKRQKRDVEKARGDIAAKAEELALASRYKSEFLSNMSHELRTPLNSLLLLSQDLARNAEGNLTEEQVEAAKIIYGGGKDLLNLINEVLDLSKIEAGRMEVQVGRVRTEDLAEGVRVSFGHMAEKKNLKLDVRVRENAPAGIASDRKRIEQIIRNLVSNALKFTAKGGVTVSFSGAAPEDAPAGNRYLAITVEDTGIGIAPEKQKIIFEAFQQADGGTARRYGGTGLGLSISRELVRLLGGEIRLESEPGRGSTFTVYIPAAQEPAGRSMMVAAGSAGAGAAASAEAQDSLPIRPPSPGPQGASSVSVRDDRDRLEKGGRTILIVEDDEKFARVLLDKCHQKGFQCIVAQTGEAGLALAKKHLPRAVILDIRLPGMDGWTVLNEIKENTRTRHIPVHIVSVEARSNEALRRGAVGYAVKPIDQERLEEIFRNLDRATDGRPKRVLVVEDDPNVRRNVVKLIGNGDLNVEVDEAPTGSRALEALQSVRYDCVVLDLRLPDMEGADLLVKAEREGVGLPPIVVHTARDLTPEEEMRLREHAESIVVKDVRSQERLLDEVSLFLHRVVNEMSEENQKIIRNLHDSDALLRGKKVLVTDDDMRTTFALARILSDHGIEALKAENGERALRLLEEHPDVDLVLMDIMMPGMDGYETMKRVRAQERFRRLPIIVLTAKAMPEDREKCLQAGASDYLTKPVDQQRLISMMRVWLYR